MLRKIQFTKAVALPAILALWAASPAFAGKADDARRALAAAQAKIGDLNRLGLGAQVPQMEEHAMAVLRQGHLAFEHGDKDEAILDAHQASTLADLAMTEARKRHSETEESQQASVRSAAEAAQHRAAAAEARADAAQQAAADASAQTEALRNTPPPTPVVIAPAPQPAPTTTTVRVQRDVAPHTVALRTTHRVTTHRVRHYPVHHAAAHHVTETTTATVTTGGREQ